MLARGLLHVISVRSRRREDLQPLRASSSLVPSGRVAGLAWGSVAIFAVVDLLWLPFSRLSFAPANFLLVLQSLVLIGAGYGVARFVIFRLDGDASRIAAGIRHAADGIDLLIRTAPFLIALSFTGGVFAWLATSAGLPLQDARLAALDAALGFDWLALLQFTNSRPALSWVLVGAYHSTGPLLLMVYLLLIFSKRRDRLDEFLAVLAMTSLATGIGMALVPAAGAYPHYDPPAEMFGNFSADAGMWHYQLVVALRTEAAPVLDLAMTKPMVTFPSFHTIVAIITTWAVRDVRWIALPVLILNAVVIVSTLPEGGHHLVDLIAGVAIAGLAILIIPPWRRRDGAVVPISVAEQPRGAMRTSND